MKSTEKEAGNALFMILIATALFAALSFAFTQGSGTGNTTATQESNALLASEILEYASQLERAVATILNNGYSENQISFTHADLAGYTNANSVPESEVFNVLGGGAVYRAFPKATSDDWNFGGMVHIPYVGSFNTMCSAAATDCTELIAFLTNIDKNLCLEINTKLGIPQASAGNPPQDIANLNVADKFTGSFSKGTEISDTGNLLRGKKTGCLEGGGNPAPGTYHFYHVLLAR